MSFFETLNYSSCNEDGLTELRAMELGAGDHVGCITGSGDRTQHAYIDGAGNLYPCDFVPLAFGNVDDRPIAELWRDMHATIGQPRRTCMLMELYARKLLSGVDAFPLPPEPSRQCVHELAAMEPLPGFYHRLTG
jgi:MoaA/NifB/PqqE/SkfB family radical SAM enzyme